MNTTVLLSRSADGDAVKAAFEDSLARLCSSRAGLDVLIAPHLYHLPEQCDAWKTLAGIAAPVVAVTWLFPRPAALLLKQHGLEPAVVLDLAAYGAPEECLSAIMAAIPTGENASGSVREIREAHLQRWYPVIDKPRCTNCGHCLQFCLFDVYLYDEARQVVAANPDNCKPGCPACSRVCPESAIMFPLYRKDEAIAGAPGKFVTPDPNAASERAAHVRAAQKKTPPPMNADAQDDIDLLINDLENLTRKRD